LASWPNELQLEYQEEEMSWNDEQDDDVLDGVIDDRGGAAMTRWGGKKMDVSMAQLIETNRLKRLQTKKKRETELAEAEAEISPFLATIHLVSFVFNEQGNACLGLCQATWSNSLLWLSVIEQKHGKKAKRTRLLLACKHGRLDVCKRLIKEHKANYTSALDADGNSALMICAYFGHHKIAQYLIGKQQQAKTIINTCTNSAGLTMLCLASRFGHERMIALLIEKGANVDAKGAGATPLIWAARRGHTKAVTLLLAKGASIEHKDAEEGGTALHAASSEGHTEIIKILLEAKADIEMRTSTSGNSPLISACIRGKLYAVKLLLDEMAQIDARNTADKSALYYACYFARVDVVRELISREANLDAGMPPIFGAVSPLQDHHRKFFTPIELESIWASRLECVRDLVNHNVDLTVQNASHQSPIVVARLAKQPEIVRLLQAAQNVCVVA